MSVTRRGPAAVLLSMIVVGMALSGCELDRRTFDDDVTERVAITEIRVDGGNGSGDVTINPGEPGKVDIHRTVEYRGERPTGSTHRIEGTVLHIRTSCPGNCAVSYVIRAPERIRLSGRNGSGNLRITDASTVDYTLGSGDVTVRGASGAVTVRTGSGGVELVDVAGPINARTSSGNLTATGIRGGSVAVETASGDVRVELAVPADVRGRTSSGNITIVAPAGDYRTQTETGSGEVQVRIATNPSGARLLDLRTGSGDIVINPA